MLYVRMRILVLIRAMMPLHDDAELCVSESERALFMNYTCTHIRCEEEWHIMCINISRCMWASNGFKYVSVKIVYTSGERSVRAMLRDDAARAATIPCPVILLIGTRESQPQCVVQMRRRTARE